MTGTRRIRGGEWERARREEREKKTLNILLLYTK